MSKRILLILASVFIIASCIIPFVSAQDYIIEPDQDGQLLYQLLPSVEFGSNDLMPYNIYGYDQADITILANPNAFCSHYLGNDMTQGNHYYYTFSTVSQLRASRLNFYINSNLQIMVYYEITDEVSNIARQYQIASLNEDEDFAIVANANGGLYMYFYDVNTKQPLYDKQGGYYIPLTYYFYGDIYIYGRAPSDYIGSTSEIFYQQGYTKGYDDGSRDQSEIFNQAIDGIKQQEFEAGYEVGKLDGIEESAMSDDDKMYWYSTGYNAGQRTNGMIEEGVTGFFESMQGFIEPFLNIGVGQLKVYTFLAILLIGGLVFIFIRLVRG